MSAYSGFSSQESREAFLKEVLAAEASQTRPVDSTPLMQSLRSHRKFLKKANLYSMVSRPEQQKHVERVRQRTSYIPPSRQGRIVVSVQLDPTTKNDLDNAVAQSGLNQQQYLASLIKHAVQPRSPETKEPLDLTKEAVTKAHEAEEAFRRLSDTLFNRTR